MLKTNTKPISALKLASGKSNVTEPPQPERFLLSSLLPSSCEEVFVSLLLGMLEDSSELEILSELTDSEELDKLSELIDSDELEMLSELDEVEALEDSSDSEDSSTGLETSPPLLRRVSATLKYPR